MTSNGRLQPRRYGQNDLATVIGRKSWLFCDTVAGANASANLYSLIETAKANGIEPYACLRTVFTELPQATSVDEIEALLPVPSEGEFSARVLRAACESVPSYG